MNRTQGFLAKLARWAAVILLSTLGWYLADQFVWKPLVPWTGRAAVALWTGGQKVLLDRVFLEVAQGGNQILKVAVAQIVLLLFVGLVTVAKVTFYIAELRRVRSKMGGRIMAFRESSRAVRRECEHLRSMTEAANQSVPDAGVHASTGRHVREHERAPPDAAAASAGREHPSGSVAALRDEHDKLSAEINTLFAKFRRMTYAIEVISFGLFLFVSLELYVGAYSMEAASYFAQLNSACAPYIGTARRLRLKSEFATVRSKQDYERLINALRAVARSHNLHVHTPSILGDP